MTSNSYINPAEPSASEAPVVTNATKDHMTVAWKPPENDGGKPVTGYYLEKRETRAVQWNKVNRFDRHNMFFFFLQLIVTYKLHF